MKEDVERRERAQATVIENQAKRLDELETLYKVCPTSPRCVTPNQLTIVSSLLQAKHSPDQNRQPC